ncbi:hypothetical protein, partial [Nonomuraea lactucae]|uniref:hypothetical protein n=1 Tax=Nonomuraea lactucae TaxID=2249762 RepID=UPI00196560E1
ASERRPVAAAESGRTSPVPRGQRPAAGGRGKPPAGGRDRVRKTDRTTAREPQGRDLDVLHEWCDAHFGGGTTLASVCHTYVGP